MRSLLLGVVLWAPFQLVLFYGLGLTPTDPQWWAVSITAVLGPWSRPR